MTTNFLFWFWVWMAFTSPLMYVVEPNMAVKTCQYSKAHSLLNCNNVNLGRLKSNLDPFNTTNIENLYLANTRLKSLHKNDFINLYNVFVLDLRSNLLTYLRADTFSFLTKLRSLDLSKNAIEIIPFNLFQNVTELLNLDLSYNRITSLGDNNLFKSQRHLLYLKINDNQLTTIHQSLLHPLGVLKRLALSGNPFQCSSELDATLTWCQIQCLNNTDVACCGPLGYNWSSNSLHETCRLECIYTSWNSRMDCENVDAKRFTPSDYPLNETKIRSLIFKNSGIDTLEGILGHLVNLIFLDLSNNDLTVINVNDFENLSELTILIISNSKLKHLAEGVFKPLSKLEYLDLQNNHLSVIDVSVLKPLISLKFLYLANNPFLCEEKLERAVLWCQKRDISPGATCSYRSKPNMPENSDHSDKTMNLTTFLEHTISASFDFILIAVKLIKSLAKYENVDKNVLDGLARDHHLYIMHQKGMHIQITDGTKEKQVFSTSVLEIKQEKYENPIGRLYVIVVQLLDLVWKKIVLKV